MLPSTINWDQDSHPDGMISVDWHRASRNMFDCNGYGHITISHGAQSAQIGTYKYGGKSYALYSTSITDIGYIMEVGYTFDSSLTVPFQGLEIQTVDSQGWWNSRALPTTIRIRFVAGSGLKSGIYYIPPFSLVNTKLQEVDVLSNLFVGVTSSTPTAIIAKVKSCTLNAMNNVTLQKMSMAELPVIGASGGETLFEMSLDCPSSSSAYMVSYYMTDIYNPTNTSSWLVSAPGNSKANGVVLQVMNGASAVSFGPGLTSMNKQFAGVVAASGGRLVKKMSVRYLRTEANASPGTLSAGVTVTLNYN
jgi:type 1 fimbria pilin